MIKPGDLIHYFSKIFGITLWQVLSVSKHDVIIIAFDGNNQETTITTYSKCGYSTLIERWNEQMQIENTNDW